MSINISAINNNNNSNSNTLLLLHYRYNLVVKEMLKSLLLLGFLTIFGYDKDGKEEVKRVSVKASFHFFLLYHFLTLRYVTLCRGLFT